MKRLSSTLLLVLVAAAGGCSTVPATPTIGDPDPAWTIPAVTACAPPTTLGNGHRLHFAAAGCVGPWRTTPRPHVALTVPLRPGAEPPGLVGSAALLVAVAADAPDPARPDTRASFRATALHDGFELVPIARPDRVGWHVHLPDDATDSDVMRAVDLLIRLGTAPTFGAALVATTAERFSAAAQTDPARTFGHLAAWALALAKGHTTATGAPPDARTLAVVNREDLARLHRTLFATTSFDFVMAHAHADPARIEGRLTSLTSNETGAQPEPCRLAPIVSMAAVRTPVAVTVIKVLLGPADAPLVARVADLINLLKLQSFAIAERPLLVPAPNGQTALIATDGALAAMSALARTHAALLATRHAPITATTPPDTPPLAETLASLRFEPTTVTVHGFTDIAPPGAPLVTDLRCQSAR